MEKFLRFNSTVSNIVKINPLFSQATVRVLYTGNNRNGSNIDKEAVNRNIYSIYNIPIVGEYYEYADNFGGHGMEVVEKDGERVLVQKTKAYGTVPESANIYWEKVIEKDGTENEYLVVDGAILWTGRYNELHNLVSEKYGQSMEIEITKGQYTKVNGQETYKIEDFLFSGLCILGIDKDGEGHVEPAFESASITAYSLNKEEFKQQFMQMMAELNFSIKEGGKSMEKELEQVTGEVTTTDAAGFKIEANGDVTITDDNGEVTISGELETTELTTTTEEATQTEEFEAQTEETVEEDEVVTTEETTEITEATEEEVEVEEVEVVDYEAKYNETLASLQEVNSNYEALKEANKELANYKRQREEGDIKAKFADKLSDEEFAQVFNSMKDADIQDVEDKLFALYGKKNFSINNTTKETNKHNFSTQQAAKETNPYGDIFED